jgi:phosphate:Na+ symporter
LGIILGSNVGSTLTSWIVATIGFKIDIESYASLVVGIFAIGMFFVREQKRLYNYFRLFSRWGFCLWAWVYEDFQ